MGLRGCETTKLAKSKEPSYRTGSADTIFTYHLFINKEGLKKVLTGSNTEHKKIAFTDSHIQACAVENVHMFFQGEF